jgi:RecJ-like exonuclease
MSAPTVPCPCCEGKGSLGFWANNCKLCDGKAYLHQDPHKCPVCSGRGKSRLTGHLFESECSICVGAGYTQQKMHPCSVCTRFNTRAFSWSGATPCTACQDKRWVQGLQAQCIICKGKGRLVPFSNSEAAGAGVVLGTVLLGSAGILPAATIGAMGGIWASQRCIKACHGCKGATVRTDTQVLSPQKECMPCW